MEELTQLKISPQEGFLLTRLNGYYDLKSIVNISSMNPLDVQLAVWKLLKAGHIRLDKPTLAQDEAQARPWATTPRGCRRRRSAAARRRPRRPIRSRPAAR